MDEILLNFIKDGNLAFLHRGMTIAEVTNLLNISRSEIYPVSRRRTAWEFNDLTLSFFKEQLDIISLTLKNSKIKLPDSISNNDVFVNLTDYESLKGLFEETGIQFEVHNRYSFEDTI